MSPYLGQMLPIVSCSMKRPTRVPASTAVRMNSASNMIAKWYQNAARPPPNASLKISEIPKARVGAPPVREIRVFSWMDCAAAGEVGRGDREAECADELRGGSGVSAGGAGRAVDREVEPLVDDARRRSGR